MFTAIYPGFLQLNFVPCTFFAKRNLIYKSGMLKAYAALTFIIISSRFSIVQFLELQRELSGKFTTEFYDAQLALDFL